ncbi:MAG TPA: hypothetical protein VGX76_25640 [Pirellulales bacterium]|nr:hypothetical protein [Pirellulales bacterium]
MTGARPPSPAWGGLSRLGLPSRASGSPRRAAAKPCRPWVFIVRDRASAAEPAAGGLGLRWAALVGGRAQRRHGKALKLSGKQGWAGVGPPLVRASVTLMGLGKPQAKQRITKRFERRRLMSSPSPAKGEPASRAVPSVGPRAPSW